MTALEIAIGVTSGLALAYMIKLFIFDRRSPTPFGGFFTMAVVCAFAWFVARLWGFA
jgi:hypothetical protein